MARDSCYWSFDTTVGGCTIGARAGSTIHCSSRFRASVSRIWTGGDFMVNAETASSGPLMPRSAASFTQQMAKARSLETSGRRDRAAEVYRQLIVQFPVRPEPCQRLGVLANRQRRQLLKHSIS